jgi:YkoY family integral membrane protein
MIEVLLSIDNALVNATIAEPLPAHERIKAIRIGIMGGAVLRLVALFFATYIIQNKWVLIIGGLYLIYIAADHLFITGDANDHKHVKKEKFWPIVGQIIVADAIFSIDNVVSAVGLSHEYKVVVAGVIIGIISMLFVTTLISKIVHKHPSLKKAAYVIVGFIGVVLLLESVANVHITELTKFLIVMSILSTTYIYSYRKNKHLI